MTFVVPPHIQTLRPYAAGKPIEELAREKGLTRIVKLASNENPLGSSPKAIEAAIRSLKETNRYVDPSAYELRHAVAPYFNRPFESIIAGAGTDALLSYIVKALTSETDEVLTASSTFIGIYVNVRKHNRRLCLIPLKNYAFDLTAIADAITPQTRLIYLANANNPTSTMFSKTEFESFMARVPVNIYVILDEAYFHYSAHIKEYPDGLSYKYDNLIVTRTFSKDYGLAGLRIGFAFAHPEIITHLFKVKLPFEPSLPAQKGAIAALDDSEFLQRTIELNQKMLPLMVNRFHQLGIPQANAAANFVLLIMPSEEFTSAFFNECLNYGLIVRHVKSFGLPEGIRINTGTEEETAFALNIVEQVWLKLQKTFHQPVSSRS